MFCALGLVFDRTEGVRSRFHVLSAVTHFGRYRGCPIPFSCFSLPNMFSAVPRASSPVFDGTEVIRSRFHVLCSLTRFRRHREWRFPFFIFCAPGLVFGCTRCDVSCFHVLRSRTRCRRFGGRRVPFSYFARLNSFSTVPRASGPVFMFCALGHVFGGTEGVRSRFDVLHARIHFRRNRGRRLPFSSFAFPDSFLVVPRASGHVFMF
jgi:hypothetical protein